ncbi:MAG: sulfotransferase family 2 domain-containing protein [Bacteroidota bacterium]
MIISHRHKFIFIKLRKAAGTSLEIALSGICGKNDIITPISKEDEEVRTRLGHMGPQNFFVPKKYYKTKEWKRLIINGQQALFYNHISAQEIKDLIPQKIWNSYYKFCFERNPWDKVISHYHHRNRKGNFNTIMDYLLHDKGDAIRGYDMYTDDDDVLVDKIYRYEEMDQALPELANTLGLNDPLFMPDHRAKSQYRQDKRNYREILSKEEADFIAKRFEREIKLMGYQY